MCISCKNEILPDEPDPKKKSEKSKTKIQPIHKQCLTCDKTVTKTIYPNKHLKYNEKCTFYVKNAVY